MMGLRPNHHALLTRKHINFQEKCHQSCTWRHFLHWMSWLTYSQMSHLNFRILHCTSFHQNVLIGHFLLIFLIFFIFLFLFGVCHAENCGLSYSSYMFSIECRFRKDLNDILKFMNDEKAMLRSFIDGVELLVFTSNQLDIDSRGT